MLREVLAKRLIDGRRIFENLVDVWLTQDNVRSVLVAFVVLSANTTAKIVLGPHLVFGWIIRLLHKRDVQLRLPFVR